MKKLFILILLIPFFKTFSQQSSGNGNATYMVTTTLQQVWSWPIAYKYKISQQKILSSFYYAVIKQIGGY